MKLILIDNFGRDCISEQLVAENVSSYWANRIQAWADSHWNSSENPQYLTVRPDDYELYKFEP
jgi:hypothetical protein